VKKTVYLFIYGVMTTTTTVEIMGGLGNQLFQIFALLGYSLQRNRHAVFEDKPISCGHRTTTYWHTPLLANLRPMLTSAKGPVSPTSYREGNFAFNSIPDGINRLWGYFQSAKYFQSVEDQIFALLGIRHLQEQMTTKFSGSFDHSTTTVSMHFRLGDYVNLQHCHNVLPLAYYMDAVRQLVATFPSQRLMILYFCEVPDIGYVQRTYIQPLAAAFSSVEFVLANGQLADWEQLVLMSLCDHHIIANSSFSWWGAYLHRARCSKPYEHVVYYPSKWFGPGLAPLHDCKDLCPTEWIKVAVA